MSGKIDWRAGKVDPPSTVLAAERRPHEHFKEGTRGVEAGYRRFPPPWSVDEENAAGDLPTHSRR
jgi:hypothetical protein